MWTRLELNRRMTYAVPFICLVVGHTDPCQIQKLLVGVEVILGHGHFVRLPVLASFEKVYLNWV
jgi:hypothetical protein